VRHQEGPGNGEAEIRAYFSMRSGPPDVKMSPRILKVERG
jgi:hypothetical protein